MKAIIYDKKSSPEVLVLREVDKPITNEDEVLVKIHNVSINAADIRSMKLGIIPKSKIFGADIAGRIEAVGSNVKKFKVGDDVFGDLSACGFGGLAEYVAVPEIALALMPLGVAYETAAAVPMAAVTALQAMRDRGNIQPGQKVLICGAGGGVGTFAVQLAKQFGAEVTAVCSKKNINTIKSIGTDSIIDYNQNDFAKSNNRYDLVLVLNGNRSLSAYRHVLSLKGTCVMSGGSMAQLIKSLLFKGIFSIGGKKMQILSAKPNVEDLEFVIKLVEEGKVKAVIDRQYKLQETAEAINYLREGHAGGKVVISV